MDTYSLLFNLLIGLLVGLGVNWLADWLPGYGRTAPVRPPAPNGWRWAGVLLTTALFGCYLFSFQTVSPVYMGTIWGFFALFLLILVVDLEHRRVLNVVVYPMVCVGLALVFVRPEISFSSALIGALFGFFSFFLLFRLRSGALGAGDVKLAGLIGLLVGFPTVVVALITAIGLGGVAAAFLLLVRRVGRQGTMAYAPYLSLGAMIALLYGQTLIAWYLERLGIL